MKKLPVEKQDLFKITVLPDGYDFADGPVSGLVSDCVSDCVTKFVPTGFVGRSIVSCFEKVNAIFVRGDYWNNSRILDKLIHRLRELTSKLEKRRAKMRE